MAGWGNSELRQYTAKNLRVTSDGLLLTASQRGSKYYSAKVCTKGKRDFCPIGISSGIRVEARLKLPEGIALYMVKLDDLLSISADATQPKKISVDTLTM